MVRVPRHDGDETLAPTCKIGASTLETKSLALSLHFKPLQNTISIFFFSERQHQHYFWGYAGPHPVVFGEYAALSLASLLTVEDSVHSKAINTSGL